MLPEPSHKTLVFNKDSFLNTSLVVEGTGFTEYEIKSSISVRSTKTRVIRRVEKMTHDVATITRRQWPRSNTVSFQGCSEVKTKKWLHDDSFCAPQHMPNPAAPRYTWKQGEKLGELELILADTPDSILSLAAFRFALHPDRPATLHITREGEHMQDSIVASILIIGHATRIGDDKRKNEVTISSMMVQSGIGGVN